MGGTLPAARYAELAPAFTTPTHRREHTMKKLIITIILGIAVALGGTVTAEAASIPPGPYRTNMPKRVKIVQECRYIGGWYKVCGTPKTNMPKRLKKPAPPTRKPAARTAAEIAGRAS